MLSPAVGHQRLKFLASPVAHSTQHGNTVPAEVKVHPKRKSRPPRKSGTRASSRRLRGHKASRGRRDERMMTASVSQGAPLTRMRTSVAASPKAGERQIYLHDFRPSRHETEALSQNATNSFPRPLGFAPTAHPPRPLSPGLASGEQRWPSINPWSPCAMWRKDTPAQATGLAGDFHSKTVAAGPLPSFPVDFPRTLVPRDREQQSGPGCLHGDSTGQGYLPQHSAVSPGHIARNEYSNPAGPADFSQSPFGGPAAVPSATKPVGILRHYVSHANDGCSTWDSSSYRARKGNASSTTESTESSMMSTEVPPLKIATPACFALGIAAVALLSIWVFYPLGGVTKRAWAFNREHKAREPVTVRGQEDRDSGFVPDASRYQHGSWLPTEDAYPAAGMSAQEKIESRGVNNTGRARAVLSVQEH